mmetsp:Transcript_18187/g.31129  ORF Transcript_18187/g.31129 Transcript_18187/m.31129 type:complete len:106 (+) Transcript_18187:1438-1755(+)
MGKFSEVWIKFAEYYEDKDKDIEKYDVEAEGNLENANLIFDQASQVQFKSIDELAVIYIAWAEMHCAHGNLESAIHILGSATLSKRSRLSHNIKCWQLFLDLLET